MSTQEITKSQAKLRLFAAARELDRVAIPLIPVHGITRAYQKAMEKLRA